MQEELIKLGLTKTEANLYIILLKTGTSSASILIKKSQLHRTTVYDVLERLIEKGLVSTIFIDNKKNYTSISPEKFLKKIEEEQKEFEKKKILAKSIVEKLNSIKNISNQNNLVTQYFGKEGLKNILDMIIDEEKDFYGYGGELRFQDVLPYYTKSWANKRREKNIKAKLIGSEGTIAPGWELNECRSVSKEYFSPASTIIFGDNVAIIIIDEPIVITLINNQKIAKSYKNYFDLLWKNAK